MELLKSCGYQVLKLLTFLGLVLGWSAWGSAEEQDWLGGFWTGNLTMAAGPLPLGVEIVSDHGSLSAFLEDPVQGLPRLPATRCIFADGRLTVEFQSLSGTFSAVPAADRQTLTGTWAQGAQSLPLNLRKSPGPVQVLRPQEPRGSLPYKTEEVTVPTKVQGIQLAATLDLPQGPGPFPAVVLVAGSGPNDRNEALWGHKSFLVLADALARRGIASLRYDKRGIGQSTGQYSTATTFDFADDAESAFRYLSQRTEVKKTSVGILGHSEGALVAPVIAARNPQISFLVLLAAPGLPGDQLLVLQERALARAAGTQEVTAAQAAALNMELYQIVKKSSGDPAAAKDAFRKVFLKGLGEISGLTSGQVDQARKGLDAQVKSSFSPWFKTLLGIDPQGYLEKVRVPVLALNGSKDLNVPAEQNLAAVRKALSGGSAENLIAEVPGLNHMFQHALTGTPEECGVITETMAPEVLTQIGDWILGLGSAEPTPTP